MKAQMIGAEGIRGINMTQDELEFLLAKHGALENSTIKEDPRPQVKDVMFSKLKNNADDLDDEDWWTFCIHILMATIVRITSLLKQGH